VNTGTNTGATLGIDPKEIERQIQYIDSLAEEDARGKAFETFADYIFTSLGCPTRHNITSPMHSEQIDLAAVHMGALNPLPTFFLVECKYWDKKVGSSAVGYFLNTCRSRKARLSIIMAKNGLTGNAKEATAAHSLAYGASSEGVYLIVLTLADLQSVKNNQELIDLLIRAWIQALASGGVGLS
jgi:hypothetical protein